MATLNVRHVVDGVKAEVFQIAAFGHEELGEALVVRAGGTVDALVRLVGISPQV